MYRLLDSSLFIFPQYWILHSSFFILHSLNLPALSVVLGSRIDNL